MISIEDHVLSLNKKNKLGAMNSHVVPAEQNWG